MGSSGAVVTVQRVRRRLQIFRLTYLLTVKNNLSAVDYTEATVEWEQWAVEDSDTVKDSEAADDS